MKQHIVLIILTLSILSCNGHLELISQKGENEYMSLKNKIGKSLILDDKEEEHTIYFEDIKYQQDNQNFLFVMGNLMGSRSSLFVAIQKKPLKMLYKEECGYCDSCKVQKLNGYEFLIVNRHYRDMCSEVCSYSVYVLDEGIYKCFEGLSRVRNIGDEDICQSVSESYEQTFNLGVKDDNIVIFANKTEENGRNKSYIYKLISNNKNSTLPSFEFKLVN